MKSRSILSHLVVAAVFLAVGWALAAHLGGAGVSPMGDAGEGSDADPATRFVTILRIRDPLDRAAALARFLESADPESAPQLRAALVAPNQGFLVDEIDEALLASWWARSDPAAAFDSIVNPPWGHRHPWVRAVLQRWVREEPLAAVEAVEALPAENPEFGRVEGVRVLVDGWFENNAELDPTPLLGLLREMEPRARAFAISRLLNQMVATRGIDATESFVESVPPEVNALVVNLKGELLSRMGVSLLDFDVERAKRWVAKHGEGRKGAGVAKHLAYYWGLKDGPAAMEWSMTWPDESLRPDLVLRSWLSFRRADLDGSEAWLTSRDPDPVLQGVYDRFLRNLAKRDPQYALELVERSTDSMIRERLLIAVGQGWMHADPESAESWLAGADLAPEVEAKIRKPKRKTRAS
jgi:hypothetical protein